MYQAASLLYALLYRLLYEAPLHGRGGSLKTRFEFKNVAPEAGLEPATLRLTAACSTIELLRNAPRLCQAPSALIPGAYYGLMRRLIAISAIALAASACSPFPQSSTSSGQSGGATTSATPTGPLPRALWVLSPVGLKLRDAPNSSGKQLATVPQGTQVTATAFQNTDAGWYQVNYQGTTGWIAAKDSRSTPPQDLVSSHPQLSYANNVAGYYFLYPASWQVAPDKGNDAEIDQASATPAAGQTNTGGAPQPGSAKMIIHFAATIDQLGNTPTTPGGSDNPTNYEIGGITSIKHVFQLTGGGLEGDAKVKYASDHSILITFRGAAQADLDTWNEILESFGFSLSSTAPSPSPSR